MKYQPYTLNNVACDWVTMTTKDREQGETLQDDLATLFEGGHKVMQYKGYGDGHGLFCGVGKQGGADNWLFQASGGDAASWLQWLTTECDWFQIDKWQASRYDIQTTIEMPQGFVLQGWEFVAKNEGQNVVTHRTSQTGDTVYLGSPKSRKMARIYVKNWIRDDSGNEGIQHIRLEFQLRREAANAAFWAGASVSLLSGLWDGLNGRTPRVKGYGACLPAEIVTAFDNALESSAVQLEYTKLVAPDTMRWLRESVDSAIRKIANDHDNGNKRVLSELLAQWVAILHDNRPHIDRN